MGSLLLSSHMNRAGGEGKLLNVSMPFCYDCVYMQRRRLPPMNALLAFEAAARHGNFTRAAEELSVAQPAVTRHINNLEAWVGAPLFVRRGNQVMLTPGGRELADLATSGLDRFELGLRNIVASDDTELRIGASFGVTHLWLMPRISAMRSAARATINFVTSDSYRDFDDFSVDASIRFGNGNFGSNASDLLFSETCQIVASPDFLASHPDFDPYRLSQTISPRQMFDHGDPHGHGWMTWQSFAAQTGQDLETDVGFQQVGSYPTMLDMIAAGEGVGIGYWGLEETLIEQGKLVRIGPTFGREGCGYYLVYGAGAVAKKSFGRLRNYLLP